MYMKANLPINVQIEIWFVYTVLHDVASFCASLADTAAGLVEPVVACFCFTTHIRFGVSV